MPRARAWTNTRLPDLRDTLLTLAREADERAPDEILNGLAARFPGLGEGLVELMARDPSPRVHEQAALFVYFTVRYAPPRLRARLSSGAMMKSAILAAMRDPQVTDERKYALTPLLDHLGCALGDDDTARCFHDYEGTVERLTRDSMTSLLDTPEQVEALLSLDEALGSGGPLTEARLIEALETGIQTLLHNSPVGAVLASTLAAMARERGIALEPALAALELVARTRTPRGDWCVNELARWPAGGDLSERARSLVEAHGLGQGRAQPVGAFSHGLVSAIDGEGARDLVLFFRTREGTFDGLVILLDERLGIREVFCSFQEGILLEAQARERFDSWAPCDLPFARDLVADAFATHERTGRPVPGTFLFLRAFLGGEAIFPAQRRPELGPYALEAIVPESSLVVGSEALANHEVYGNLGSTSDSAYAFARRGGSRARGRNEARLEDFLREVVVPERDVLLARLSAALEVEARAGRARRPQSRLAARTYLGIESEVVPFEKIPYVRAISRDALAAVERNVKKGFRSQAEASAALAL